MRVRLALWTLTLVGLAQASMAGPPVVSLDPPGTLERLRSWNPTHYAKAVEIIGASSELTCKALPGAMQARFQVQAQCKPFVLWTSYPPQGLLSFTLDGITYETRIVFHSEPLPPR